MPRPLMQLGVGDLEALFSKSKTDVEVLKQLEHELQYRQVPRAVALLAQVRAATYGVTPAAPAVVLTPLASAPRQPTPPTAPAPTPAAKAPQPAVPVMPLEDAYKLLKSTAGSTWESIEQTRRQLVQQSHPARLKSLSPEKRVQVLAEAKRVNAAYDALCRARCTQR